MDKPLTPRRMETRERLLDAALAVFAAQGLQSTSVETICAAAGFSRGAFYSNFSSKEELFLALLEREYGARTRRLELATGEFLRTRIEANPEPLSHDDVAEFISSFFRGEQDGVTWFVLETELLLLATRDEALSLAYLRYSRSFLDGVSAVVADIVASAGLRLLVSVEDAVLLLAGVYERSLRARVLARGDGPDGDAQLAGVVAQISRVLIAITVSGD